jgi:hypothetical protein
MAFNPDGVITPTSALRVQQVQICSPGGFLIGTALTDRRLHIDVATCPTSHEPCPDQTGDVLNGGIQIFDFHLLHVNREFQVESHDALVFLDAISLVQWQSLAHHLGNTEKGAATTQWAFIKSTVHDGLAANAHDHTLQGNCAGIWLFLGSEMHNGLAPIEIGSEYTSEPFLVC